MSFTRIKTIAEKLGWDVKKEVWGMGNEPCITFSQYSNAGEDFSFTVGYDDVVYNVQQYYEDFDALEHAKIYDGMSGAPDLEALIEDAKDIEKMLESLAYSLSNNKAIDLYAPKKIKAFKITPEFRCYKSKSEGYVLIIKLNNRVIEKHSFIDTIEEAQNYIINFLKNNIK